MEMTVRDLETLETESEKDNLSFSRPVDLVHLARFTLGDRDLEKEVLQLFARQSVIYLDRLKQADTDKAWRDAAHTIKGSARGVGAWQIAAVAESAEKLSGKSRETHAPQVIETMEEQLEATNGFIGLLLQDE